MSLVFSVLAEIWLNRSSVLPWSLAQAHTILTAGARTKAAIFNSAESAALGCICVGHGVSCGNSEFSSMMCEKEIQLT